MSTPMPNFIFKWDEDIQEVVVSIDMRLYIEALRSENQELMTSLRKHFEDLLSSVGGHLIWPNVLAIFKDNLKSEEHGALQHALSQPEEEEPLALKAMRDSFLELVKNAIDAKIIECMADSAASSTVRLSLALHSVAEDVTLKIEDNCGGFPDSVIRDYTAALSEAQLEAYKKALDDRQSGKNPNLLFGGQGAGLKMLGGMIRYGCRLGEDETIHDFDLSGVETSMVLSNGQQGACITIKTPIALPPAAKAQVEEVGPLISKVTGQPLDLKAMLSRVPSNVFSGRRKKEAQHHEDAVDDASKGISGPDASSSTTKPK